MADSDIRELGRRFAESGARDDGLRLRVALKRAGESASLDFGLVSNFEVVRFDLRRYSYGAMMDALQDAASEAQPFVNGRYRPLSLQETVQVLGAEDVSDFKPFSRFVTCSAVRYRAKQYEFVSECRHLVFTRSSENPAYGFDCDEPGVFVERVGDLADREDAERFFVSLLNGSGVDDVFCRLLRYPSRSVFSSRSIVLRCDPASRESIDIDCSKPMDDMTKNCCFLVAR